MSETYSTAFMLLLIGMITVFVILALVVIMGNVLILVVNRFMPGAPAPPKSGAGTAGALPPSKLAAIVAAVDMATQGKGKITHIEKQN